MDWLEQVRHSAQRPPVSPRLPLLWNGQVIGTVAEGFLESLGVDCLLGQRIELAPKQLPGLGKAWCLSAPDATVALNAVAQLLRDMRRCGPWRDEQLAVCTPSGQRIATIERGAVRVLGIATQAVHLVGVTANGRMWVQQRSQSKPNFPGKWDTLMGGMVNAADTLSSALARETREEAGLDTAALPDTLHGGHIDITCPSKEGGQPNHPQASDGIGYMRERIDWFCATLTADMQPINQDGEVAQFQCIDRATLMQWLAQGQFTPEATLVLGQYLQL